MKPHLGCGERYINGYINIDFPSESRTVMDTSKADIHTNILELNYSLESIDEIRLHHVFEHFTRPVASALIAGWYSWLKPGGKMHIEVPDFEETSFGYNPLKIDKNSWLGTYNFEIISNKSESKLSKEEFIKTAENYFRYFLVGENEFKLLEVWMNIFVKQLEITWAKV